MFHLGRRFLLGALLLCGALLVLHLQASRLRPLLPRLAPAIEGSFTPNGEYVGQPSPLRFPLRRWGSWSGGDQHVGRLSLGPFPAPATLQLEVGGYPNSPGNSLFAQLLATGERVPLQTENPGEHWRVVRLHLPVSWRDQPIHVVAIDQAVGWGGWLAVSEPLAGGAADPRVVFLEALATWLINGLLLGVLLLAMAQWTAPLGRALPQLAPWLPLLATAGVALAAYLGFWLYFAHHLLGRAAAILLLVAAGARVWRRPEPETPASPPRSEFACVALTTVVLGLFFLGVGYLYPTTQDVYWTAAYRFGKLPADNLFPHLIAERFYLGENLKERLGDWLVSDRPPLQTAWLLLVRPAFSALPFDPLAATATAALWFQLTWIAAAHGLFRSLGFSLRRTSAWIATLGLSGFFLLHSVFTWPKLSAAAFACGAFGLWVLLAPPLRSRATALLGAVLAALAWLSHGGVAFSFLALAPWVLWHCARGEARRWLAAALVFLALAAPWIAYQKFYDPPGDRLLKWHLAGQIDIDPRGTLQALRENYAALPPGELWKNKLSNLALQSRGAFHSLFDFEITRAQTRRSEEFTFTSRALTWWLAGLVLLPVAFWKLFRAPPLADSARQLLALLLWVGATIALWCLLMFRSDSAIVHQGSFAAMLAAFVLFSAAIEFTHRWVLLVLVAVQSLGFVFTWAQPSANLPGSPQFWPLLVVVVSAAAMAFLLVRSFSHPPVPDSAPAPNSPPPPLPAESPDRAGSLATTLQSGWQTYGQAICVLVAVGAVFFLRKPHALLTPQLWAEDGAVFLVQHELAGLTALTFPYAGYLHTLPRLIVAASSLADPAWWPHLYNYTAFALWLAIAARVFSPRFRHLPGKPWLALALIAVPHSGEVFFNITNLQWVTAFVLIQQLLIAPATTRAQRISDILILAVIALTGPFAVAFLPLFFLRWLLESRSPEHPRFQLRRLLSPAARAPLYAFATVLLCSAIQLSFVRSEPRLEHQAALVQLWTILEILSRRLFAWPLGGREFAFAISPAILVPLGPLLLLALGLWVLRRHPLRRPRAFVLAAFVLITLAGLYRTRPDTWPGDNYDFADRYFYIPRVLLAWLLIWEFHSRLRALAVTARLACLLPLLVHLRSYSLPAPIDYEWAKHIEPIRRGVPGNIPTLPEGWILEYRGRPSPAPSRSP